MIREVRSKVSKAPEDNYTEAVCDVCQKACPESRLSGRRGIKAADDAETIAHRHGYVDRQVRNSKGRRFIFTAELLCPECQTKNPKGGNG